MFIRSLFITSTLTAFLLLVAGCKKEDSNGTDDTKPVITQMVPDSGTKGTIVQLTGSRFTNDLSKLSVYLNGKPAVVNSTSLTNIEFVVPPGAGDGTVSVVVNGLSSPGPAFDFIYTVTVNTFTGMSLLPGLVNGDASVARFNTPRGLAIDANDNLYVADEQNHCIRRISPSGDVVTFSGTGLAGHGDGTPGQSRFNSPADIVFDPINEYFYVADKSNHCIRKISLAGDVITVAGIPGSPGYVDAPGNSARFFNPQGVAVEGELVKVYIADAGNNCIRRFDDVGVVTTLAGNVISGNQDGTGAAARFNSPFDIAWDTAGYLMVTDAGNHNVRRISVNGEVSTLAGAGTPGYQDGAGSLSLFNSPSGVIGENQRVIVCDALNHRIRFIDQGNMVTTLAGDGTAAFSDGIGTQAKFSQPGGIVRNSMGDYFITDTGNNAIRRITID